MLGEIITILICTFGFCGVLRGLTESDGFLLLSGFILILFGFFLPMIVTWGTTDDFINPIFKVDHKMVVIEDLNEAIITAKNPHTDEILKYTLRDEEYPLRDRVDSVTLTYGTKNHFWIKFESYGLKPEFSGPNENN